jgi:parallel beta-helix repeat protein
MRRHLLGLAVGVAGLLAVPATSFADVIDVFPGESIQHAVNRAHRGDVIKVHDGNYRQSVAIRKNGLTLKGSGTDLENGSVLRPGHSKRCGGGQAGICIRAHKNHGNKVRTNKTVVKGFLVKGFEGIGLITEGGKHTTIAHNRFAGDGEYGTAAFSSIGTKFTHNLSTGNDEAGFYVGDSPHANAVLRHNKARGNGSFGFFLRDSAHGVAQNNTVVHNCLGIGVLNTSAPTNAKKWLIKGNQVNKNNKFCKGNPPVSGTGIGLLGARSTVVRHNRLRNNKPSKPGAPFAGGIVVISSKSFGGTDPARDTISNNSALGNRPADIRWDGSGFGNHFENNNCNLSQPSGLCS